MSRFPAESNRRRSGTFPPLAPSWLTWKSPLAVRSVWVGERVLRTSALEPLFAVAASLAASLPLLTTLLCTLAVPSPPVCTVLQAEKFPLSNPSLKSVAPGAGVGVGVAVADTGVLVAVAAAAVAVGVLVAVAATAVAVGVLVAVAATAVAVGVGVLD